jgi:hypothetical protein
MYDYPNSTTIEGILSYPTQGSPYFWLWILVGIFFISAFSSFFAEVKVFGKGKLLSSLVVSSFFVLILAVLGNVVGFITKEILILIIIFFIIFTAIFIFSSEN